MSRLILTLMSALIENQIIFATQSSSDEPRDHINPLSLHVLHVRNCSLNVITSFENFKPIFRAVLGGFG